jgi:hypothetical protein
MTPDGDAVEVWNGLWASERPRNADNEAALTEWDRGLAADIHCGRWRPATGTAMFTGGRYWDRTSDLFRVKEARSRCANRPNCPAITRGGDGI